ncbi:MAG: hypothetical protein H0V09_05400 [Gemmatimonadetes bacterium]|nr:hypothetical protein [Gemmatimonadota bacterium]
MTLGAFSTAVGSSPRWVQNAFAALRLPRPYSVPAARRLALARELRKVCGMPLVEAHPLASRILLRPLERQRWERSNPDGSVLLAVDLERFLSTFAVRLSLSCTLYAERVRGRPARPRSSGISLAREWGVDIGLLESSLRRSPGERVRKLDEDVSFVRSMRVRRAAPLRGRNSPR